MKAADLPFEEILIFLDRPETGAEISQLSPSQRVPCLFHGELRVWDSLAICEYIAELAPDKSLWPTNAADRAVARSYAAEMHSGFHGLRAQLSMDIRLQMKIRHLTQQSIVDIQRIISLWESAISKSGGPFLFGPFGIADAFFAPVVFRFLSYGLEIESKLVNTYMQNVTSVPYVNDWAEAARREEPRTQKFKWEPK